MAFTETKVFETIVGNRIFGAYKLTGDGSDTTWSVPVKVVDSAWTQATSEADTTATVTWATNVITFGIAPQTTKNIYVFYIGI